MKLHSVKILGEDFRSLPANKLYEFNITERKDRLSTKVFAGLNGSGKSNFLELLAEIFFYLEKYLLESVGTSEKKGKNIGFEIEFQLPSRAEKYRYAAYGIKPPLKVEGNPIKVRIIKPVSELPEISIKTSIIKEWERIDLDKLGAETLSQLILPSRVIAYTSGQNELLSNPFFKFRYHYFKEIEKDDPVWDNRVFDNNRLIFLDNSNNFAVFIANMLLASKEKLSYLNSISKIQELHSFRITINYVNYKKNKIPLKERVQAHLTKLKLCATTWIERKKNRDEFLILDYKLNNATLSAFKFHFDSALELFKVFYDLENLNLHSTPVETRSSILKAHKSLNIADEIQKPDPSRLFFRIEKIKINKIRDGSSTIDANSSITDIYYKGLSDGEHQFNEILGAVMMMEEEGCLFLMDEPDTHFNPVWRAKFIEMLNRVSATQTDANGKIEEVRQQEIIITTHSPFIISDSQTEDVYKFDKPNGEVTYINPKIETYGASVTLLLQEIFDRKISISDLSNFDLDELRKEIKDLKTPEAIKAKIEETKNKLLNFGESIEKFDLYSFLRQIEKETEEKK